MDMKHADAVTREIRTPSEWIMPAFETVTVVTKDGQRIRGAKKAEDVFTIQIMDSAERIQGYRKAELQDVIYEKTSLMPAFPAFLLLVAAIPLLVPGLFRRLGDRIAPVVAPPLGRRVVESI